MFIDYYGILAIDEFASQEEIKSAFKKQALKWHPDRNLNEDTNERMRQIIEASTLLSDIEARNKYNIEYQFFKKQFGIKSEKEHVETKSSDKKNNTESTNRKYEYKEYAIKDDILNKWMKNARMQAVEISKQSIEELTGMITVATKAVTKQVISYILFSLFFFLLIKACSSLQH